MAREKTQERLYSQQLPELTQSQAKQRWVTRQMQLRRKVSDLPIHKLPIGNPPSSKLRNRLRLLTR